MSGDDLLRAAADELYAGDLDVFTERRKALAAEARAAGETEVASQIAGLRKPTRSAWTVNRLVRADPSVPGRLSSLADDLRAAEAALDGQRIRELSQARRELVDALVRQALGMTGESAPSAALAEEVTVIFGAALADPQVASQLAAGTLVRAEQRAGFEAAGIPALALVPDPAPRPARKAPVTPAASGTGTNPTVAQTATRVARPARAADGEAKAEATAAAEAKAQARAEAAAAAAEAKARAAAAAAAEAEREQRRALAEAEQAAADASRAVRAAASAVHEQQAAVRRIEEQLTEAREALAEARIEARQAENAQRRAQQTLDRLRR
ncbi:MAG TPA: hypothetical protein VIX86_22280 [Streptosporangiaceae bacterium]